MEFFATTVKGMEALLAAELGRLGVTVDRVVTAGVAFSGPLEAGYRACLGSRIANRVLLPIAAFAAPDERALYEGVRTIDWTQHLTPGATLAVDFSATRSQISHTHFGALKTKDAIVDQLRERRGTRPSIDTAQPSVRVNVYLLEDRATLSIDLSGDSLHRRGYRLEKTPAPLKENLAAALLLLVGWPERTGAPFLDPMCGSGTLPIEAALMAAEIPPGLGRHYFGFLGWAGHDRALWARLIDAAKSHAGAVNRKRLPPIVGYDGDAVAVRIALAAVERAGLRGLVHIERRAIEGAHPIGETPGLLVTNPPYGVRLGEADELIPFYRQLGDLLRRQFPGWTAAVLTGNPDLAKEIGLRAARRHILWNGPIECRLLEFPISAQPVRDQAGPSWRRPRPPRPESEAFRNRLTKDLRHLRKWARRDEVSCFRVYDADLPEYAVAVDLYEDAALVQEYQAPSTVDPNRARERLEDVLTIVPEVLEVAPENLFLRVRRRQHRFDQYEKLGTGQSLREVREGGLRFLINLSDYLDTGLFLDHRSLRALIRDHARDRDLLNLFAYTGTASVYAADGGARSTTSIDRSNTYLDWARRNFELNGLRGAQHRFERADCLEWLAESRRQFGLIFVAPPTFSNSKSADQPFDLQKDHVPLLQAAAERLTPDGIMLFSCHARRFRLDEAALSGLQIENIHHQTLPPDFVRSPRIHNSWQIRKN